MKIKITAECILNYDHGDMAEATFIIDLDNIPGSIWDRDQGVGIKDIEIIGED